MINKIETIIHQNIKNFCEILSFTNIDIFAEIVSIDDNNDLKLPKTDFYDQIKKAYHTDHEGYFHMNENGVSIHFYQTDPNHIAIFAGKISDALNNMIHETLQYLNVSKDDMRDYIDKIIFQSDLSKKVFESIPEYIAYKSKDGIYRIVSKSSDQLYSKRFDTIVGKSIEDLYPPEIAKDVRALDQEVYDSGEVIRKNVEIDTDHGPIVVDTIRNPIIDKDGEILGVISVSRDISELVEVKDHLSKTSKIQNTIIDIANQFINYKSHEFDNNINQALAKIGKQVNADRSYIFEYNFEQNTMDNTYEWCKDGVTPQIDILKNVPITDFLDDWVNVHRNHQIVNIPDIEMLDHSSKLYEILSPQDIQSVITMPLIIEETCFGFIGFDYVLKKADMTKYKSLMSMLSRIFANYINLDRINKDLEYAKDEAMRANNAKSDFLAKLSHEIKTPLNGVYNAVYLLEDSGLDSNQKEYLDITKYSIDSLSSIIDNILDYSRIEAGKLNFESSTISLEEEMISLIRLNKYMAIEKDLGIYLDYDYNIPRTVHTDVKKLRQILNNLVQNAIKYTNYGHVILRIKMMSYNNPYVDINFEIIDTGIGISEKEKKYIFNKFYRTEDLLSKNATGTGLGLPITYELVKFMNGEIDFKSTEKVGSTFSVDLKLYAPVKDKEESYKTDKKAYLLDLSLGSHTNMPSIINPIFSNITKHNLNEYINRDQDPEADYVIVYVNDSDFFFHNADKIYKNKLKKTPYILVYDNTNMINYRKVNDFFKLIIELPVKQKELYDKIQSIQVIKPEQQDDKSSTDLHHLKKSILLVDDNRINRKALASLLKSMGIFIEEASNGYEAIDHLKKTSYDLIFMDIQMPGLDGYETTKRIRQEHLVDINTPIVAVTAYGKDDTIKNAYSVGMNDILLKPILRQKLVKLLKKYFKNQNLNTSIQQRDRVTNSEIFDKDKFEKLYQKRDMRLEIIDTFLDDYNEDLNQIKNAFDQKSITKIQHSVHYVKGSFAYLQASKIMKLAKTILSLCDENNIESIMNLRDTFIFYYKELVSIIQLYRKQF